MTGKAYSHRIGRNYDQYPTPRSLVRVAAEMFQVEGFRVIEPVLEPCAGEGSIRDELVALGYTVQTNDVVSGVDYLTGSWTQPQVITNPPFRLWDQFVIKALGHAERVAMIGRLNYFGTHGRHQRGLWRSLRAVYCFDRYVDFRTPVRSDGLFYVGAMATAWFVWDQDVHTTTHLHVLDVQDYATLGGIEKAAPNNA